MSRREMEILCNAGRGGGKTSWLIDRALATPKARIVVMNEPERERLIELIVNRLEEVARYIDQDPLRLGSLARGNHRLDARARRRAERMVVLPDISRLHGTQGPLFVDNLEGVLARLLGQEPEAVTTDAYAMPLAFAPEGSKGRRRGAGRST